MADNFIFEVGGNIDGFKKTISQVEAELKRVRGSLKDQLGQGLVDANKNIAQLEQSIVNLKNVGLDKLPKASNNGAAALFSLSQVARDAPFGFIAIQNNLPLVVDQFTALSKSSGGLKGALKDVGTALVGPAGLSFAFGAIIAGVTALVQKYGSLGEAFNQILGLTPKLTEAQKKYKDTINETSGSVVTENAKINILVKTLTDLQRPFKDRLAAYNELKRIAPDVVAGIRDENALSRESIIIIQEQAKAQKELSRLKVQEAGINAALTLNETKLAELRNKFLIVNENYLDAVKGLSKENKNLVITGFGSQTQQEINNKTFNDAANIFKQVKAQIEALEKESSKYLNQLDPIVNGIANINLATQTRINLLKQQIQAEKDAAKETGYWSGFAAKATFAGNDFNKVVQNNAKNLSNWNAIMDKIAEKMFSAKTAFDGANNSLSRSENFQMDNIFGGLFAQDTLNQIIKTEEKAKKAFKSIDDQIRKQEQTYNQLQNTIQSALIAPLEYLSNTVLEKGKFSWQEFGKVVLKTLAGILTSIIATTIAASIANAIIPGAGTAGVAAYNQANSVFGNTGGKISPTLAYVPMGLKKEANLSGLSGGGMALSGSVVMVQRGSDLVGVLSRTNASINKVG